MTEKMIAELPLVAYAWRKEGMKGWALGHGPPTPNMLDFDKHEVRELTFRSHHATLADMAKRLEAAERDSKRLRNAKTATVEFDETIDGEHVGVIPFPHSAVGRRYKLVCIDATQEGEG